MTTSTNNVASRLADTARTNPDGLAIAEPLKRGRDGVYQYRRCTFAELQEDSDRLAAGLLKLGLQPGARMALMVRPGIDFISLVFAMLKARIVMVLIDPGLGRRNLIACLQAVNPDGFVAIPLAQAIRTLLRRRFPRARTNVTVGRRWFWGGTTISRLRSQPADGFYVAETQSSDPAAIIFTSGSTGPPKGVLYEHGTFVAQVEHLQQHYGIQPGDIDLPGFPLFALFNSAMGVSTILPEMDFTQPASVDPQNIIDPVVQWNVTQSFGSPTLWNTVGRYCESAQVKLPTLKRIFSAGAPVPPHVLARMKQVIAVDGDIYTPYGATEALPVASISASEVLSETETLSRQGAGTCVGTRFSGMQWRVIEIDDRPLATLDETIEVAPGQIGELIVQGAVVTPRYVTRTDANADHKITDGDRFWHRMGDVGYLDPQDRFWFCGRKGHRVITRKGILFTVPCEAIINNHPAVYRSALVGIGEAGNQRPVIVVETWPEHRPGTTDQEDALLAELRQQAAADTLTQDIVDILLHPSLPVDIRHNAKIFREKLAPWAAQQLANTGSTG